MARPSKYTKKLATKICKLISTTSQGLKSICDDKKMPDVSTVHRWLAKDEHKEFQDMYTRAREAQADLLADQIIEIADDSSGDTIITEKGHLIMDSEFVARSRLKVDARKWKASKLAPRKYGDKIQQEVSGPDGAPIAMNIINFGDVDPRKPEEKKD